LIFSTSSERLILKVLEEKILMSNMPFFKNLTENNILFHFSCLMKRLVHFHMLSQILAQFLMPFFSFHHISSGSDNLSQLLAQILSCWHTFSAVVTLSQLLAPFLSSWHNFSAFGTLS
jgi:hypothetical protein